MVTIAKDMPLCSSRELVAPTIVTARVNSKSQLINQQLPLLWQCSTQVKVDIRHADTLINE